jgi:alkylation response protein AidB-like acyl-CoA dehydrogenase
MTARRSGDRSGIQRAFEDFVQGDGKGLPVPGGGETWRRFEVLASCAAEDLSFGRLVEGHVDALAILAEAHVQPLGQDLSYGVWAARSDTSKMVAEPDNQGWRLSGTKEFCSGSQMLDRALVTAETPQGYQLFDIAPNDDAVTVHPHSWAAVGMADSKSDTLTFDHLYVPPDRVVGSPGFYTERPGFWFGAVGVAACWYGGAVGLVNHLLDGLKPEPSEHVLSDLGLAVARVAAMRDVLQNAATEIDSNPFDNAENGQMRALVTRQTVHDAALDVLALVASAGGARPLCHEGDQARRAADLFVYLSQHHGRSDGAALGRLVMKARP